jgi:hypothetical protein
VSIFSEPFVKILRLTSYCMIFECEAYVMSIFSKPSILNIPRLTSYCIPLIRLFALHCCQALLCLQSICSAHLWRVIVAVLHVVTLELIFYFYVHAVCHTNKHRLVLTQQMHPWHMTQQPRLWLELYPHYFSECLRQTRRTTDWMVELW